MTHETHRSRSSSRDVTFVFATRVAMYPISFLVSVLVARALGPGDRGLYAFLGLLPGLFLPLFTAGWGASIVYLLGSRQYEPREVATSCAAMGMLQGAACASGIGLVWWLGYIGRTGGQVPGVYMISYLVLLPLQGAALLLSRVFLGTSWFSANNVLTLLSPVSSAVLMAVLVLGLQLGLKGAVLAAVGSSLVGTAYTVGATWWRFHPAICWNKLFVEHAWKYGRSACVGDIALRLNLRVDQALLSYFAMPAQLGAYSIAVTWSELLWIIPDSLGAVTFTRIAGLSTDEQRAELVTQIHRSVLGVMFVCAVAVCVVGAWAIPLLYGNDYKESWFMLVCLLPGSVAVATSKVAAKYFSGSGQPGVTSAYTAIGSCVGVVMLVLWLPKHGAIGAGIASSLGYFMTSAFALLFISRSKARGLGRWFGIGWKDVKWIRRQLVARSLAGGRNRETRKVTP